MIRKSLTAPVAFAAALAVALAPVSAMGAAPKGPTEEQIQAYLATKPEATRPLFRHVMLDGERNLVLNLMRAGLASMDAGDLKTAGEAFDQALDKIEIFYANNPAADKARSKFVKEAVKDFKGDGYERAMAYYYRGVLHLHEGDYDNARASFMSGQLQDQWAEDQQYASDFAFLDVLAGWASHCANDESLAQDFYGKARLKDATIALPGKDDRVLLVAEVGGGPQKWADGKYNEIMHYRAGDNGGVTGVYFRLGDAESLARAGENVFRQASTRGGRKVDDINAGKATFKSDTANLAQGTGQAAMLALQQSNAMRAQGYGGANTMAYAGMAMGAFSLLSAAASAAAKPQADIRYWDNLPNELVYVTLPPAGSFGQIEYRGAGGAMVSTALVEPQADSRGVCSVSWSRDGGRYVVPEIAPNSELKKKS